MNTDSDITTANKQSYFRKLIQKLFPIYFPPEPELVGDWAPGHICVTVTTKVDIIDLLRLMITRRCQTQVHIKIDVGVNKSLAFGEFSVLPPKWTDKL